MRPLLLLIAAAIDLVTSAGCASNLPQLRGQLRAQAAGDLHCTPDQTKETPTPGYWLLYRTEGCGKTLMYVFRNARWESPLERAAFEFSCPKDQLEFTYISDDNVGVSGCGHKGVYVRSPNSGWLLNSAGQAAH